MNYNRMFDLLFSEAITEDVKLAVVEKVRGKINEEVIESSPLTVLLSTLVYEEEVTEEALNDIIDIVFEGMTEDEIERVLEEFKRDTVVDIMEWDPAPVGLRGVEREAAKQQAKQNQPKAIDKLKSAAGKVKTWAGNVAQKAAAGIKAGVEKAKQAANQPTGLDKLKQMRSEMIDRAVKMGTGAKSAEPKAEQLKMNFNKPAAEEPKVEPKAPKAEVKQPKPVKPAKAPKAAKPKVKPEPQQEAPKAEVKQPKPVKPAAKKTAPKKPSVKKAKSAVAQAVAAAEEPKKEVVPVKRGRKKITANEALEEVVAIIKSTNISESTMEEIIEMISNKKAAEKAVEREYNRFTKAVAALNRIEELKAKTGSSPVSKETYDEMMKKAEACGNKYEQVKTLSDKKFNK